MDKTAIMVSHNIYYSKRIFDLSWGIQRPLILGCFEVSWVVALLISIELHVLRTRARLFTFFTKSFPPP